MEGTEDSRLDSIERTLDELRRRVERLEGPAPAPAPPRPQLIDDRASTTRPQPRRPAPPAPRPDLEEFFGGRVLAWVGGLALLIGTVFFLGMAIRRGWIDEPTRTVLAFLGSTSLLLVGVWLHERAGRTEAALAAVASALSALYATLVVATQTYDLIAPGLGLACAALVGVVGVAIAVRWSSAIVAAIGILGALLAPVLVGAGTSDASLAFVAIALAAAVGILLWQRWDWLALGAFAISAPQLLGWVTDNYDERLLLALSVIAGFGAIYIVAAIGYEVRARSRDALPTASWLLLLANVVLVAGAGYFALEDAGHPNGAVAWLLGLAAAHILLGGFALRQSISREIGSLLVAAGLGLSALGFADALDGPVLVVGWAIQAVVLAYLATRASRATAPYGSNAQRLVAGALGYLALAFGHILAVEAPPLAIFDGVQDLSDAAVALGVSAAAALWCGLLLRSLEPRWAQLAELAAAASLVFLGSVVIVDTVGVTAEGRRIQAGQVWLSAFWTVTGLAAVVFGLLRQAKPFRLAGLLLLGVAIGKVYTYDIAALDELARVLSFIALGLFLLAGAFAYQWAQVSAAGDEEATEGRRS